jgi:hypothetical protein
MRAQETPHIGDHDHVYPSGISRSKNMETLQGPPSWARIPDCEKDKVSCPGHAPRPILAHVCCMRILPCCRCCPHHHILIMILGHPSRRETNLITSLCQAQIYDIHASLFREQQDVDNQAPAEGDSVSENQGLEAGMMTPKTGEFGSGNPDEISDERATSPCLHFAVPSGEGILRNPEM